jgi:phosphoglycolate phosphatase-like HAD superfamily hydrolase
MLPGLEPPDGAVFLDVDGVLLDPWPRYLKLHEDLLSQLGGEGATGEDFVRLKRERATLADLTGLSPEAAREYQRRWNQLCEAPAYLALDRELPQAVTALRLLKARYTVVLTALRRKPAAFREQLKALDFPSVAQVLVAEPRARAVETKARMIQASPHFSRNAVCAGDTEVDIRAGKELGLTTIAVRGGLRSDALLAQESPDLAVDGVAQLPSALRALFAGGRP